jgi:hypothetical protein
MLEAIVRKSQHVFRFSGVTFKIPVEPIRNVKLRLHLVQHLLSKCQPHLQAVFPVIEDEALATESRWYNHNISTRKKPIKLVRKLKDGSLVTK